jgi:hypothetical protein
VGGTRRLGSREGDMVALVFVRGMTRSDSGVGDTAALGIELEPAADVKLEVASSGSVPLVKAAASAVIKFT